MAKFKYKFGSIKRIKIQLEKKTKKELSIIELEIEKRLKEIADLKIKLKEEKAKVLSKESVKIMDMHFHSKYEKFLEQNIDLLRKEVEAKKVERSTKLKELVDRTKETKTFEKLEEKHFEDFIKEQDKIEQIELDEIAVQEFLKE